MPNVELVYEKSCPNIQAARELLLRAFNEANVVPHWREWETNDADTPTYARAYGSPTILVNGKDVSGEAPGNSNQCCRVYTQSDNSHRGVPALALVVSALQRNNESGPQSATRSKRFGLNAAVLPSIGAAMLPKLACPACWPAYAGLLSSLGIGFIDYTPYLLPMTLAFVFFAVCTLFYRARNRNGYGPFVLGVLASGPILFGKFYFDSDSAMFVGIAMLVVASVWNTWPSKRISCSKCLSETA